MRTVVASREAELEQLLIESVVEGWRFSATCARVLDHLPPAEANRFRSRESFFKGRLEQTLQDAGFSFSSLPENSAYDEGFPVTPINLEDFAEGDVLVIDRILEPIVVSREGAVRRMGVAMLRKVEE